VERAAGFELGEFLNALLKLVDLLAEFLGFLAFGSG